MSRDRDEDRGGRSRSRDDDRDEGRSRSRDDDRGRERSRDRDDDRSSRRRDDDRDEGRSRSRDRDDDDRGSRRGGSRFQYQDRGADAARKRQSQGPSDFDKFLKDGIKMYKVQDGLNRLRILPPTWPDADHYGLDIYMHYGVGPDRQSYLCLEKMLDKPDPIAEARAKARDDGDDEYAKELDAKKRVLVYVVDRDHPKEGVQAWAMPWTLDRDISKVSEDRSTGEVLKIDHPEEGYDIEFERKGKGNRTEYMGVAIARRSTPLGKDEWLDFAQDHPLPDQLVYYSYDEIAKAFGGKGQQRRGDRSRDDRDEREDRRGRGDRDEDRGRSRDRDDRDEGRPSDRGRDRDDSGSGRDRGGRSDRERDDRGSDRSRNDDPDTPTWASVHEMSKTELLDLIDNERLDINPGEAKDTEDLADWVCEEMKLKKEEPEGRSRRRVSDEDEDRLRDMRECRRE